MKILVLTEGGKGIGFGHITRCMSLCQAFEAKRIQSEFIVNGDEIAKNLLQGHKNRIVNWLKEDALVSLIEGVNIVIIDSYLAEAETYRKISEIAENLACIDDNKRLDYPKGFVVNSAIYANELDYPKRDGIIYLLGARYMLLRKEFWDTHKKEIKDKIETILVTFGGDDSRNMTPKILRLLKKRYPLTYKKVIIGGGFKNRHEIEMLRDKKTEFLYNLDARGMRKAMQESDIAVTAGGQTLYEFAAIGLPAIGICVAGNQLNNLKGWQKAGFVEYAGQWNSTVLFRRILECIESLKSKNIRMEKSRKAQRLIDGKGCSRVRDFLLERIIPAEK